MSANYANQYIKRKEPFGHPLAVVAAMEICPQVEGPVFHPGVIHPLSAQVPALSIWFDLV